MNVRSHHLKQSIKRTLQYLAAASGRHTRTSNKPQLLILMYHRILPHHDERAKTEEPGMLVTPETFRQHMMLLKSHFTLISLSDWARLKRDNKSLPKKACVITFDDGWADNYEFAFPILQELDIPATIFLVSDMIDSDEMFWPERLARLVNTVACHYPQYWSHPELDWLQDDAANYRFSQNPASSEQLAAIIASAKDYSDQEMHDRLTHIEKTLDLKNTDEHKASLLNWQQIKEMLATGLIEVGSHTCRHIRLNAETPEDQVLTEVVSSKRQIEDNTGHKINTFCYPNGDTSPFTLEQVKQHYDLAVTTQTGWNTIDSDLYSLKRIGIHQDITADKTAFLARISGWM